MNTVYAFNDRRYWSARKVKDRYVKVSLRCSACGYPAHHYQADYNADAHVFTVPYAGLNGGIGEERESSYWTAGETDVDDIMLSRCCDAPSRSSLKRLAPPADE